MIYDKALMSQIVTCATELDEVIGPIGHMPANPVAAVKKLANLLQRLKGLLHKMIRAGACDGLHLAACDMIWWSMQTLVASLAAMEEKQHPPSFVEEEWQRMSIRNYRAATEVLRRVCEQA